MQNSDKDGVPTFAEQLRSKKLHVVIVVAAVAMIGGYYFFIVLQTNYILS